MNFIKKRPDKGVIGKNENQRDNPQKITFHTSMSITMITVYEIRTFQDGEEYRFMSKNDAHDAMWFLVKHGVTFTFMERDVKVGSKIYSKIISYQTTLYQELKQAIQPAAESDSDTDSDSDTESEVHTDVPVVPTPPKVKKQKVKASVIPVISTPSVATETVPSVVTEVVPSVSEKNTSGCVTIMARGPRKGQACQASCLKGQTVCRLHVSK